MNEADDLRVGDGIGDGDGVGEAERDGGELAEAVADLGKQGPDDGKTGLEMGLTSVLTVTG